MTGPPNAPRRIIPCGVLGPPESPAPPQGRFRTRTIPLRGPFGNDTPGSDGYPIPPVELWRGYGQTPAEYLRLAQRHVDSMLATLEPHAQGLDPSPRVLDFGCAAGPMLRILRATRPGWELWGCDIDPIAVDWCRRNLCAALSVFTNTTAPHLPLPDAMLDLVYAGSVFTHIEHLADAWLLELARVLRPGALLYVTIHDRAFIRSTIAHAPDWRLTTNIIAHFSEQAAEGDWSCRSLGTGPNANIFYDRECFLRMASAGFEPLGATERAYGDQTALLLRRRI
ncbi:MAG: class I SAM-dependent methyltransferase [Phycisphaeraceae bacterium]|nr:class I SAM-dependent methyltransferase [Phycisphaeraceae bacterium]